MKLGEYDFPGDLYYDKGHSWVKIEDSGTVRVGMNDFFQQSAGEIVSVDLPFEGDDVQRGETCGKIQSGKWVQKLASPLTGTITNVNTGLEEDSSPINRDPYGEGWIMVLEPSNLDEELRELMRADSVEPWLKEEIERAEKAKKQ